MEETIKILRLKLIACDALIGAVRKHDKAEIDKSLSVIEALENIYPELKPPEGQGLSSVGFCELRGVALLRAKQMAHNVSSV